AVDAHGRPALLRNALGSGRTVFCTYPIEHMAARTPAANPENTWRLYSALADEAGVSRPVRVADGRVLVGLLRSGASTTVLFVNCSNQTLAAEPIAEDGVELHAGAAVILEPFGVAAIPCSENAPAG